MQVEAALRQGESVRWLSSNPAQQHEAPGRDPSALLHRLQLGQASAASPSGPQVRNVAFRPFTRKLDMIWGPLLWRGTVVPLSGKPGNHLLAAPLYLRLDESECCLQSQGRSLAEVLLALTSTHGQATGLSLPWGPSAEDALLGVNAEQGPASDEEDAASNASSKVLTSSNTKGFA